MTSRAADGVLDAGLALALLAMLGSCASQSGPKPNPADAVSWNFYFDQDEAKLAFGRPNTDEVGLMMSCKPHAGRITLSAEVSVAERRLTLASGARVSELAGSAETDPMTRATLVQASTTPQDVALSAFARSGRLALVHDGHAWPMAATDRDRDAVRRFFKLCA